MTTYPDHGFWLETRSGLVLDYLDPRPEQVSLDDISTGLAHLCRFGGQTGNFFSVAQHSVIVSVLVPPELALVALLHDATETYVCDVPSPLKRLLGTAYSEIEDRIYRQGIAPAFGLPEVIPAEVKAADTRALLWEGHVFAKRGWFLGQPFPEDVQQRLEADDEARFQDSLLTALEPFAARRRFWARFQELTA